jgi:hypothetical protein
VDKPGPRAGSFRPDCYRRGFGRVEAVAQAWLVHRWKAPRAQPTSLFFAEGRVKRPSACRRPRESGSSRARALLPFAGWGVRGGIVIHAGVFSRRGNGLTTRGVRADRVGVVLPHGRPQGCARGIAVGVAPVLRHLAHPAPLARETSAGGCRRGGARLRPRSLRRAALPVLGAGTSSSGEASAAPLDADPRRRRYGWASARPCPSRCRGARRAERASARWPMLSHAGRGSGGRQHVLADQVGCRSRRAALGPGRKAMGLALWLPAHAGELSGRTRAGSRVAAAKAASTRAATPVAGSP